MVLECFTWIPLLCRQIFGPFIVHKKGIVSPLPDDVVVDILSRLPADCVLECRRVCWQWHALTSTPHFAELHLKRATPVLLLQRYDFANMRNYEVDLFIFDEAAKEEKRITKIRVSSTHTMKQHRPLLIGSCNGLLLFRALLTRSMYFIFNPITQEQITIGTPHNGFLCGIFFHLNEYKLLGVQLQGNCFQYFISTREAKIWRYLTSLSYRHSHVAPAALVNGSLHWMVQHEYINEALIPPCTTAIMAFHMDSEDFCAMPHPGTVCRSRRRHRMMRVFEMKEYLSFCHVCVDDKLVDVWVLEDYAKWVWVKKYKVNLDWDPKCHPFDPRCGNRIRLLNIQNGELVFDWVCRGLFCYDLERNTVKEIKKTKLMKRNGEWEWPYEAVAYTKSLIALNAYQYHPWGDRV